MNIFAVMYFDAHTHNVSAGRNSVIQSSGEVISEGFFSIGIHPWHVEHWMDVIHIVKSLAQNTHCIAIGETGLDKNVTKDLSQQLRAFEAQIDLSEELELPLILHCVKSWPEVLYLRKRRKPKQKWIFHGFSKKGLLQEVLKENVLLSFGEALINESKLGGILQSIPLEKILLETDNSEIPMEMIYKKASDLLGMEDSRLQENIELNFKQTFTKWYIG